MIIGVTGLNGSGKTSAAVFLTQHGFLQCNARDLIKEYTRRYGLPDNRDGWRETAVRMRDEHGPAFIVEEYIRRFPDEDIVIESIRNVFEARLIKEKGTLLAVEAPREVRFERLRRRGNATFSSFKDFVRLEEAEFANAEDDKNNLQECVRLADMHIVNDGTQAAFEKALFDVLERLRGSES